MNDHWVKSKLKDKFIWPHEINGINETQHSAHMKLLTVSVSKERI